MSRLPQTEAPLTQQNEAISSDAGSAGAPVMGEHARVAILNRGEPAMRFLRALREYNFERGCQIQSVAFVTEPDLHAPFAHMADDVVYLGEPLQATEDGSMVSAYCHHPLVISKLKEAQCDAVWPGWGFVSEDPVFVARLEEEGIVFLGPSSDAMLQLGDKIASKELAETCGVPLADWSMVLDEQSEAELLEIAEGIGYPLMVKASAGGGGRGIRKVKAPEQLISSIQAARDEVKKVFGQGGLFMEACITEARHIEVQFLVGADGKAFALGVRDCSIQRRNQKVIEEGPSPVLATDTEQILYQSTVRLAEESGYRGVGTAEFLYKPASNKAFFLEVNSRLQVEHTVTEMITGCDLVKAQIDIARGLPWMQATEVGTVGEANGHAIEVRLCAEDPEQGFRPSPGFVKVFRAPFGPGIRVDNGVMEGVSIAPQFDSMIAKVIAWAPTRKQAIARLTRALRELEVVVEDGITNKGFLLELLEHPAFVEATANTSWLDGAVEREELFNALGSFEALMAASILEYRRRFQGELQQFFSQVQNGIPQDIAKPNGRHVHLRLRGQSYALSVYALGEGRYRVGSADTLHDVMVEFLTDHSAFLHTQGKRYQVLFAYGRAGMTIEVDGSIHIIERASGGRVKAPSPAMVVHIAAEEGDEVASGDLLCTLEAMKMEMPVYAQEAGTVRSVLCHANQQVRAGQALMVVEPAQGDAGAVQAAQPLPPAKPRLLDQMFHQDMLRPSLLTDLEDRDAAIVLRQFDEALRAIFLGYDITPLAERRIEQLFGLDVILEPPFLTTERYQQLAEVVCDTLRVFVDVEVLFERGIQLRNLKVAEISPEMAFYEFCRRHQEGEEGAPPSLAPMLKQALRWFGVSALAPTDKLRGALWRLAMAHAHGHLRHRLLSAMLRLLMGLHDAGIPVASRKDLRETLAQVTQYAGPDFPFVADNARQATYVLFEQSRYVQHQQVVEYMLEKTLELASGTVSGDETYQRLVEQLSVSRHSLLHLLVRRMDPAQVESQVLAEAILRRMYANASYKRHDASQEAKRLTMMLLPGQEIPIESPVNRKHSGTFDVPSPSQESLIGWSEAPVVHALFTSLDALPQMLQELVGALPAKMAPSKGPAAEHVSASTPQAIEVILCGHQNNPNLEQQLAEVITSLPALDFPSLRLTVTWCNGREKPRHITYQWSQGSPVEIPILRDIHPEAAARIELWRLQAFSLERLEAPEQIYAFRAVARDNPKDERICVFAEVRNIPEHPAEDDHVAHLWEFEQAYFEGLRVIREAQSRRQRKRRLHANLFTLFSRTTLDVGVEGVGRLARRFEPQTRGLGLQKVAVRTPVRDPGQPEGWRDVEFLLTKPGRHRMQIRQQSPSTAPLRVLTMYDMRVIRARQLGTLYPYEIIRLLEGQPEEGPEQVPEATWSEQDTTSTPGTALEKLRTNAFTLHHGIIRGHFQEYDFDASGQFGPVTRPPGENQAGVVVGVISHETQKFPEGMERVWIASDPTRAMGSLSEPECVRVEAALELAEEKGLPVEWIPISAGAKIAMDSGTENLDWTARVLRRIVSFTQGGGIIHLIVTGVNVGAQSYWNAMATMLMHTTGVLIMTPEASMVLTGKKALEVSGSVSAEDEIGIGGFDRIMGPNGQAQYIASNLGDAYRILFEHYRFAYKQKEQVGPRWSETTDPADRSILTTPYVAPGGEASFQTVGDIFDERQNPGRKKPFAIRAVMAAVIDQDGGHLERYQAMRHAETAVVWDAHLGGCPVCMIGFESQPQVRRGRIPMDGPDTWTGGTLYPQSSKKVARAINAASQNRPVVVLANLSGFDGSPESLRKLQLEMGAEIGRAVVNFEGPLVFVVVGRYHGGAYVVFSKALNPNITALALKGTFASVIGGAPAAAVVFPREARRRTELDARMVAALDELEQAPVEEKPSLREKLAPLREQILLEKQGEIAREFDAIHTVERAVSVGSIDGILPPERLRPAIIDILTKRYKG